MRLVKLNKNLFWDVKVSDLDIGKNTDFIISRVLVYGDIRDFKIIKKIYGLKKIRLVAKKTSYLNKKDINFWSNIFNIPLNQFRCLKRFSPKISSVFYRC